MHTEYSYAGDRQILEISTTGVAETLSWPLIIRGSIEEGRKYSCIRYLFDLREATIQLNLGHLFGMPRNAGEFKQPMNARVALLFHTIPPAQKELIESFNSERGFNVKVFLDRERAVGWLEENASPPSFIIGT